VRDACRLARQANSEAAAVRTHRVARSRDAAPGNGARALG
jgi:hypothetical protein